MKNRFDVGVWLFNQHEYNELNSLHGSDRNGSGFGYPCGYNAHTVTWLNIEDCKYKSLTEFKEQGIMKYSAGDVLVNENNGNTMTIQGYIGGVCISIDNNGCSRIETEKELYDYGYTLKTETTKTDMSVSEIEKALGKAAGSLNVVAE